MRAVVEKLKTALARLNCPLYAGRTDDSGECAVYQIGVSSDNGSRKVVRMQLHIRAESMSRGLELETAADRAIVPLGDRYVTDRAVSAIRNGGGSMSDGDWHIRIAYYDIVLRA